MSTTPPAERALFARLVDDAAVFPPAADPLPLAVRRHLARRHTAGVDLVGPLLVPVAAAVTLHEVLAQHAVELESEPLQVGLIGRPGTTAEAAAAAVQTVQQLPCVEVAGVELGADADWQATLRLGLPLSVEVPRDPEGQQAALAALAAAADGAVRLQAKLRTQSTPEQPVPTTEELAGFVAACAGHDLPFKLTGGLHHAVRGRRSSPAGGQEDQHGVLNVLLAAHRSGIGASPAELADILAEEDAARLAANVRGLDRDAAAWVRQRLTSFGCCAVLDPLGELAALGLISDPTEETS